MTINEIITNETTEDNFTDDQIIYMAYGIRNFDARVAGMNKVALKWWFVNQFHYRDRLNQIERDAKSPSQNVVMVKCSCGHTVPEISVLSSSMGSSCVSCYDSMDY